MSSAATAAATTTPGPRTPEGKAHSSQNALKHGLTGAGKVLPPSLALVIEARTAAFTARFQPADEYTRFLVGQLAIASARLEQCLLIESEMIDHFRRREPALGASDRFIAALQLYNRIHRNPPLVRQQLLQSASGRACLLRAWTVLKHGLQHQPCLWTDADIDRALDLQGVPCLGRHADPAAIAMKTQVATLRDPQSPSHLRHHALESLTRLIDLEIATASHTESVSTPHEADEASLRASGHWFDSQPDLARLRRYEAAARRLFYTSLALLEQEQQKNQQNQPQTQVTTPEPRKPASTTTPPAPKPKPTEHDSRLRALEALLDTRDPQHTVLNISATPRQPDPHRQTILPPKPKSTRPDNLGVEAFEV